VQDGFVKVFSHIKRHIAKRGPSSLVHGILINGALDRRRRGAPRPLVRRGDLSSRADEAARFGGGPANDREHRLLARERRARMAGPIDRLDGRQRTVFMLCHYGVATPREVSA